MRRGSSFCWILGVIIFCLVPVSDAVSNTTNVAVQSEWDVTSYKVNLQDHAGGSGDIQIDQNGWIHLGANHLEGGDIKYQVQTGTLTRADILEVWVDGYSTSNDLNIGPTVFVGTGKNRFEQITRVTGDAWRPFVFRFADDAVYGDVTDPSNRNENWRIRYPSSKYEIRRIDKSPSDLLDLRILPLRISVTGAEDFIIKRIEVVVYRAQHGLHRRGLYIVSLDPYKVQRGGMVNVHLNRALSSEDVDFYIIDPTGHEHKVTPRVLNIDKTQIGFHVESYPFSKSGRYQLKLVDRSNRDQEYSDTERFEFVLPAPPRIAAKPKPAPVFEAAPPAYLPPIPQAPPAYIVPMMPSEPVLVHPGLPALPGAMPPIPGPVGGVPPVYADGYTIQIGAYRIESSAIAVLNKLRSYGYDAYISESTRGFERLFRVRVGRYPSKSLANSDASRLRSNGFDTWITELG